MALIVQKFGGATLSDAAKIRKIARHIADLKSQGNQIVAVVSAMGYTTDELTRLAYAVARRPAKRELDMLLSVGERITMSLLAMSIEDFGVAAVSFTGSQVGIITDTRHTEARIVAVQSERLRAALDEGKVVVVAGFQGVSLEREITTLGRGGSDTTAIALAAALGADRCDLIKEVPGIFTSDPALVPGSVPIPEMDFASVRGLSLGGARILKDACIDLAEYYGIELRVGTPQKQTVIRPGVRNSHFSIALKEGYSLYKNLDVSALQKFPNSAEVCAVGDEVYIFFNSEGGKVSLRRKNIVVISGVSKLTTVGEGARLSLPILKTDSEVKEIFSFTISPRESRIFFSSTAPKNTLRRVHDEIKKKLEE